MSIATILLLSALLVVALVVIGLVAATETAFTRVTKTRVEAIAAAEADDAAAAEDGPNLRVEELQEISRRPATTLASLALVGLAAQAGAAACGWILGQELAGTTGGVVAVVVVAILVFATTATCRSRSLRAPDIRAVELVPILRLVRPLGAITSRIVRLSRGSQPAPDPDPEIDEQELLALVGETSAIAADEELLIKRAVAFDDQTVGSIMTPRPDTITLRSGFAVHDALQVAALHGLSRIPITAADGDIDDIIGAVHVKDLMGAYLNDRGGADIDLWLREVPVVPEVQLVKQLLQALKTSDMHLAVVIDEHGGVAGVVTLEDILEELVGEIEDEFDQPEPYINVIDNRTVQADGRCELPRIQEVLGVELVGDARTIAGRVFNGLGRVPQVGDVLQLDEPDLEIEVLRMHGRRIADVEVRTTAPIAVELRA